MAKIINGRFVQKHDIEANWLKATGFIPLDGEIIVYEADETCAYPRFKVGDGATNVNDLPFAESPAQADWNQNDPSAPDYVKNRTHWEEGVILPETEFKKESGMTTQFEIETPLSAVPIEGKTYVITVDGVAYESPAIRVEMDGIEIFAIGNASLIGLEGGVADVPYCVMLAPAGVPMDEGTTHTVYGAINFPDGDFRDHATLSIVEKDAAVHKLDPKFLPDIVVMAERPSMGGNVVILPETTPESGDDGFYLTAPLSATPTEGATALINYNGVEYACTIAFVTDDGISAYIMGNMDAVNVPIAGGNPDAPFVVLLDPNASDGVYGNVIPLDGSITSITISIIQKTASVPQQLVMDKDGNIKWEDRTHWVEGGTYDVLPEATYADDASIEAAFATPLLHSLIIGEVYQVNFNGTIYECTCIGVTQDGITIPVLGDTSGMNIPGGNPDAPFVFMEIPRGIPNAPENMYWQPLFTGEGDVPYPLTFGIKYEGEIIHKIDNKFLDIVPSNWNALPGTPGHIENRTHYCDHVVMTYDSTKLAGVDMLTADVGGNSIVFYKIGDYVLDAAALQASSYTCTVLSTGEQSTTTVAATQDNNGWSAGISGAFFIYSIYDLGAASVQGVNAPSTGTYLFVISEEACIVTVDSGEIIKKIDEKYLPDNTINMVNSVNGQTGDVVLTAVDVGAVADTLNIENGVGTHSLQSKQSYADGTSSVAIGRRQDIATFRVTGDGESTVYTSTFYAGGLIDTDGGAYTIVCEDTNTRAQLQKTTLRDDDIVEYQLSNTLSKTALTEAKVKLIRTSCAFGNYSVACGFGAYASGMSSVALGHFVSARGNYAHALGYGSDVTGLSSFAEGTSLKSNRANQFVFGKYNIAESGPTFFSLTESNANQQFYQNTGFKKISGVHTGISNAGFYMFDSVEISEIEDPSELSVGDYFCKGNVDNSQIVEYYQLNHSFPEVSNGWYRSVTVNVYQVARSSNHIGQYVHIIGNGDSVNARSNAHAIDWDGNAYFAGDVYVQGNGKTFEFDGKKKLVTEEYVNSVVSGITYESIGAEKVGAADEALVEAKAYTDSKIPTPEDALALMIEMGFVDPVADESGAMYTDANGEIFTY